MRTRRFFQFVSAVAVLGTLSLPSFGQVVFFESFETYTGLSAGTSQVVNNSTAATYTPGWSISTTHTVDLSRALGTAPYIAQDGLNWVDLTGSPGVVNGTFSRSVALDAGDYQFSFWYFPRAKASFDLTNGPTTLLHTAVNAALDGAAWTTRSWQQYTGTFSLGSASSVGLTFTDSRIDPVNGLWIDSISIVQVPEPTSSAAIFGGLGLLGAYFLRRHRRHTN